MNVQGCWEHALILAENKSNVSELGPEKGHVENKSSPHRFQLQH